MFVLSCNNVVFVFIIFLILGCCIFIVIVFLFNVVLYICVNEVVARGAFVARIVFAIVFFFVFRFFCMIFIVFLLLNVGMLLYSLCSVCVRFLFMMSSRDDSVCSNFAYVGSSVFMVLIKFLFFDELFVMNVMCVFVCKMLLMCVSIVVGIVVVLCV